MGATTFVTYSPGRAVREAFSSAISDAHFASGHGGYSGTVAEKGSFVVISELPLWRADAEKLAYDLIDSGDLRINDKWGPAGAIAVCHDNRAVVINVHANSMDKAEKAALVAAEDLLAPGESVVTVRSPNSWHSNQTSFDIEVEIRKAAAGRLERSDFRVRVDGSSNDSRFSDLVDTAVAKKLRVKSTDIVRNVRTTGVAAGSLRIDTANSKNKVTRYLVHHSARRSQHDRFETGFATKAEAVAYAKQLLRAGRGGESASIATATRSEEGTGLVSLYSSAGYSDVVGEATIVRGVGQPDSVDGWVFFGWASE